MFQEYCHEIFEQFSDLRHPSHRGVTMILKEIPKRMQGYCQETIGNEKSARSFAAQRFSETPSGHGRPRLRVKDVCAKNFIFLHSEQWGECFWARTFTRISAVDVHGVSRPKTLCFGCFSVPEFRSLKLNKTLTAAVVL